MNFLKIQQIIEKTTLCRTSIYNLIKAGEFPGNFAVVGKRKVWLESEVEDWMMEKIQANKNN